LIGVGGCLRAAEFFLRRLLLFASARWGLRRRPFFADGVLLHMLELCARPFRWHPRWRLRGAGVAPVRGGTYFSLQRQRKVGKRKPLTPPARIGTRGPPQRPHASHGKLLHPSVANVLAVSLTRFMHGTTARRVCRQVFFCGKLCVGCPAVQGRHDENHRAPRVCSMARRPSQSLPQGGLEATVRVPDVRARGVGDAPFSERATRVATSDAVGSEGTLRARG
jgi:hypothetical protein